MRLFPKWWRQTWLRWSSWCWLAVLVCSCGPSSLPWNIVFCSLSPLQSLKTPLVVSPQRTTCIHLGAASRLSLVSASFIQTLIQDGIISVQQCPNTVQIPDIGTKALPRVPLRPLQINFLATGTLAANDFHLALPKPVRLLIYSSCFSWCRWCMCFVILLMCHICCIVAYTSLSSF